MSRGLDSALNTLANSAAFPPAWFVFLDWPGAPVRVWSGYGDIVWGGYTWLGVGHLGGIGNLGENTDLSANAVPISLSGIPSAEIALALADDAQGSDAAIYLGGMTAAGALVSDPQTMFEGFIDFPLIEDNGETAKITLTLSKDFSRRNVQPRRFTHEDQQIENPTDMFFSLLAGNTAKDFTWGRATTPAAGSPGASNPDTGGDFVG